mmetsp:Transcript_142982/g.249340  ORF Transcript_142982/g.249340 Transcript_142982/m.249340 type:complete len:656 (-) Transcript_142982:98-2065(-)
MTPAKMLLRFLLVWLPAAVFPAFATRVTPVQRVLELMMDLKAKAEGTMAEEAETFAKYDDWAISQKKELEFEISTDESELETLGSTITSATSDIKELKKAILELTTKITGWETEKAEAEKIREKEYGIFLKEEKSYMQSIDAVTRAIDTISATNVATPQEAAALLQRMEPQVPGMSHVLAEFLQETSSDGEVGAPAAAAYTFQSGGVLDLLDKVLEDFKSKLSDFSETERKTSSAHQLQMQSVTDSIKYSKAEKMNHEKSLGEAEATLGEATASQTKMEEEHAENKKLLQEVTVTHQMKSATFAQNQKSRKAELAAIGKAIEIISGGKVKGTYDAKVASLSQQAPKPRTVSLLQMFSTSRRAAVRRVSSEFLQRRSVSSYSPGAAPFAKVTKMMEELVQKLKEEAASEATHEELCQKELKANKEKRDAGTLKVSQLTAQLEELESQIEHLNQEISYLNQAMADLTSAMTKETELRQKENLQNTETIAEAEEGAAAVKEALNVLNSFYTGFIQQKSGQVPKMDEYKGATGSSTGILGMLEVIQSDFLTLKAETTAAEESAAKDYKTYMDMAKLDQKAKAEDVAQMKSKKDHKEGQKHEATKMLKGVKKDLEAANNYFQELNSACVEVKVDYGERVAAREKEIQNLKEAYSVLDQKR